MSTEYYRLKKPFTSVRTRPVGVHVAMSLWVNHAKTGELTLRQDEVKDVLLALARGSSAVRQFGTADGATQIEYYDDDVEDDTILISQYGELTSVESISQRDPEREAEESADDLSGSS